MQSLSRWWKRYVVAGAILAGLATILFGSESHSHQVPGKVSNRLARAALGPDARKLDNGLYEVTLADGYRFLTHGPDPDLMDSHGTNIGPGDPERPPVCATGHVTHVLYGHPAGIQANRLEEFESEIRAQIRRINAVLNDAALESGNTTADYKVACDAGGDIRIDTFEHRYLSPYLPQIVLSAREAGFDDPKVDYLIFYDGDFPGICGFGEFYPDTTLAANNGNNDGAYGVAYRNCWFSRTPMHEGAHMMGAVQTGAPREDGGHHCNDPYDVLCLHYTTLDCPEVMAFDCSYDTYFDAAPEDGEWLASHWNLGSRLNRYILFGDQPPAAEPSPSPFDPGLEPDEEAEESEKDPGVSLEFSDARPQRGERIVGTGSVEACEELRGTWISLQRRIDGQFVTEKQKQIGTDCDARFKVFADFKKAVFRAYWPKQVDGYVPGISSRVSVRVGN